MTLAQALGYQSTDKLLIINADDYGMCHSANAGIQQLLDERVISSTTIMMTCPWATEAAKWAALHPHIDIGIHLTFTSEWNTYRWGPVTRIPSVSSLYTEEGFFPHDCLTFEKTAHPEHVYREIISQINLAQRMGIEPTHLDNHMGSLYGLETGRDYLGMVIDICARLRLPLRMPRYSAVGLTLSAEALRRLQLRVIHADACGVIIPDYIINLPFNHQPGGTYSSFRKMVASYLHSLRPGVTEIYIHPAIVTEELKAIHSEWRQRDMELEIFRDPVIQSLIKQEHIHLISWRDLQKLQHSL